MVYVLVCVGGMIGICCAAEKRDEEGGGRGGGARSRCAERLRGSWARG